MKRVRASVGIHNGKQCYNVMSAQQPDQQVVMELLNRIPEAQGGTLSVTGPKQFPAPRWGICSKELHAAILRFQKSNPGLIADGHVDPNGHSILRLNKLAGESGATTTTLKLSLFWAQPSRADVTDQVAYARQQLAAYNIGIEVGPTTWSAAADLPFANNRDFPDDVSLENLVRFADQQSPHAGRVTVLVMEFNRFYNAMTVKGLLPRPFIMLNAINFGTQVDNAQLLHELNNAAGGDDNEVKNDPPNVATTPASVARTTLTPDQVQRLKKCFFV